MAINKITDETINKLRKKSAKALPDKPSEKGYTADQLKSAFSGFVIDDQVSIVEEINKIVDSVNGELSKIIGTSDSNGTIMDKISKMFQSQNPILTLTPGTAGKIKCTSYNNRNNTEIEIMPENTIIATDTSLVTLDGTVALDTVTLLSRISKLESNYKSLTENAPETLDTISEIAAALKNNANIIDTLVVKEIGKGLSSNDFTNAHKEKLEGLNGLMVTQEEKDSWDAKSDFSGDFNDLSNIPDYVTDTPGAFDYNNLKNLPTIPSVQGLASEDFVEQKINDLIGAAPDDLNTLKELADVLTNQQSTIGSINEALKGKASATHTHTKADITNFPDIYYKLEEMIETDSSKHFTKAEKEKVATIDSKLNSNLGSNEGNKILITDENGNIKTALAGSYAMLEDTLESTSTITAPTANQVRILNNIKLDINQSSNNAGKCMKVGDDGNLTPYDIVSDYKKYVDESISDLPTKEFISTKYLPLLGGTMLGKITFPNDTGILAKDTNGNSKQVIKLNDYNNIQLGEDGITSVIPFGNLKPADNKTKTYDLGTTSGMWRNIYGQTLYQNGTKIDDTYQKKYDFTLTGAATTGYRLVYQATLTAWRNLNLSLAISSRHQGNGILTFSIHCNDTIDKYDLQLRLNGTIINTSYSSWITKYDTATGVVSLYWYFYDYSSCACKILSSSGDDFYSKLSNGTWYDTLPEDTETTVTKYAEFNSSNSAIQDRNGKIIDETYLPKTGGTMTGVLNLASVQGNIGNNGIRWDTNSLPEDTSPNYILTIDSFANGGRQKWSTMSNIKSALGISNLMPKSGGVFTGEVTLSDKTYSKSTANRTFFDTYLNIQHGVENTNDTFNISKYNGNATFKVNYETGRSTLFGDLTVTSSTPGDWCEGIYIQNAGNGWSVLGLGNADKTNLIGLTHNIAQNMYTISRVFNGSQYDIQIPTKSGTFALTSDIPTNYDTTDTEKTITAQKTILNNNLRIKTTDSTSGIIFEEKNYEGDSFKIYCDFNGSGEDNKLKIAGSAQGNTGAASYTDLITITPSGVVSIKGSKVVTQSNLGTQATYSLSGTTLTITTK